MTPERRRTVFAGRVQGVGFRMTCASIARRHRIAGFVRNLPDGSVELVTEGDPGEIERFLGEISAAMNLYITSAVSLHWDSLESLEGFEIRG